MTPNWLRVERAMTFFRSNSIRADIPAISMVREAKRSKNGLNRELVLRNGKNRNTRNTPAVTRVDEWTSAETGVGAAIAAGSHLENGIWALFVIAARERQAITQGLVGGVDKMFVQWPWFRKRAIVIRRNASPIRFIRAVIMPAPRAVGVWK